MSAISKDNKGYQKTYLEILWLHFRQLLKLKYYYKVYPSIGELDFSEK